jgi:hypothetical protein
MLSQSGSQSSTYIQAPIYIYVMLSLLSLKGGYLGKNNMPPRELSTSTESEGRWANVQLPPGWGKSLLALKFIASLGT